MSLMDRYHVLVHDVSALFGYDYNDTTPDWVHPFIHLILVLAPGLLIGVAPLSRPARYPAALEPPGKTGRAHEPREGA